MIISFDNRPDQMLNIAMQLRPSVPAKVRQKCAKR